jgi:hypothetical protein
MTKLFFINIILWEPSADSDKLHKQQINAALHQKLLSGRIWEEKLHEKFPASS